MILEVRHLRMVVAIAESGTVSRAAQQMFVTQAAISRQLLGLERRIGRALFHRTRRGMVPTDAGASLLDAARAVLPHLARAETALVVRNQPSRRMRVGTPHPLAMAWMPQALSACRAHLAHVDVQLVPDIIVNPLAALRDRSLDVAVLIEHPHDLRLEAHTLFEEELVALVSASHPLAEKTSVSREDIAVETLVLHEHDACASGALPALLTERGMIAKRVINVALPAALRAIVRAEDAIGIAPRWQAADLAADLRVLRVTSGGLSRTWYAIARRGAVPRAHLSHFASAVARIVLRADLSDR
ncbi:MAG TPA: LysR family transcriptional regulator [Gemmatimonadaceae bacterium]|nr:LysR family transcriptional regulator [Gemmatimonadaceae bacterium]